MEHSIRAEESLADTIDELDEGDSHPTEELWHLARTYSRLRHRHRRDPDGRERFEDLKVNCLRRATTREPELFLIFIDPGFPHLLIVYHQVERTFLHVPLAVWNQEDKKPVSEILNEHCAV
jgi:hypothetical protein